MREGDRVIVLKGEYAGHRGENALWFVHTVATTRCLSFSIAMCPACLGRRL